MKKGFQMYVKFVVRCSLLFCIFSSGCINTFVTVYMEDGVRRGLYRGLSINYLRVVPQVAVMFSVYELTKQFLSQEVTSPARSEWLVYAPSDSLKGNSMKVLIQPIQLKAKTHWPSSGNSFFGLTWHWKDCKNVFQERQNNIWSPMINNFIARCWKLFQISWVLNRILGRGSYTVKRTHFIVISEPS